MERDLGRDGAGVARQSQILCQQADNTVLCACRACGSWTGAALNVQNTEVPMCKRCQKKWDLVACGHDVPLYNQDGNSDLLKQHVQHKLETCLQGDTSLSRRKAICDEALLEVHQAWIVHNGEE